MGYCFHIASGLAARSLMTGEHVISFRNMQQHRYVDLHSGKLRAGSKGVGEATLATVLAVVVEGHENASTALGSRTLPPQALDLSIGVDLIVLENGHLDLLTLVLDFLRSVVSLLLTLLSAASET